MSPSAPDAGLACRFATVTVLLNLVGMSIYALFFRVTGLGPLWPPLQSIGVSAALLLALRARRRDPSVWLGSIAFLINMASILVAFWVSDHFIALSGRPWVPFQPEKLGALAAALLAPPKLWMGVFAIIVFTATPLAHLLLDAGVRTRLPIDEPWATLAYGFFALGLLIERLRRQAIEREMARATAEAASLERFTRDVLAVRDLTNTPLQTLELNVALMYRESPEARLHLDRMKRAIDALRKLNRILDEYELRYRCRQGDESFDPAVILKRSDARRRGR